MTNNDKPLRDKIEQLLMALSAPTPPQEAVAEAVALLSGLRAAARKIAMNTFKSFDQAVTDLSAEYGAEMPEVVDFVQSMIDNSEGAQIDEKRIALARSVAEVSTQARLRGLWEEHMILRSLAWIMVEPTGIAVAALRQQLYLPPVSSPLLSEFSEDCGPIGAATDLAMMLRELAKATNEQPQTN